MNASLKTTRILIGVIAVCATLSVWYCARSPRETIPLSLHRVKYTKTGDRLFERGTLVSMETLPVEMRSNGDILEIVPSGTPVKKGDVVARIDSRPTEDTLKDKQLNIESNLIDMEVAEKRYELVKSREENRIKLIREQLAYARIRKEKIVNGLTERELRQLEITYQLAELNLEKARESLERNQRLFDKGFISATALEPYERRVETAHAYLNELKITIRLKKKNVRPEEIVELDKEIEQYETLINRRKKAMERRLEQVRKDIDIANANKAQNEYRITFLKMEIKDCTIRAPMDGIMSIRLHRDWRSGGQWIEYKPGVRKWKYDRIADIVNPGKMRIDFMVHESDINRIRKGQKALIKLPALPGQTFTGNVISVDGVGRDRFEVAPRGYDNEETGVTMFKVSVMLEGEKQLHPGMSAMVEVILEEQRRRLVVPRSAVQFKNGNIVVRKQTRSGFMETVISGRPAGTLYFEVTSGLEEGDVICSGKESS